MAKFKIFNVEKSDIYNNSDNVVSRFTTANSRKESAKRMLDQIDSQKNDIVNKYKNSNNRFASNNNEYDYNSKLRQTTRTGYESEFKNAQTYEDYENMNQFAASSKSVKRSGYEMSDQPESPTDLVYKYFYSQGSGVFTDPKLLEEILVEKENKRLVIESAKEKRKLAAEAKLAEIEEARQRQIDETFDESGPFAGLTTADLSKNRIRRVALESTSDSKFGILNEEQVARREKVQSNMLEERENRNKKIKRAFISDEEKRAAWDDYEKQRSSTMQSRFSESPIIRSLRSTME